MFENIQIRFAVILSSLFFLVPAAQALEQKTNTATLGIETEYHRYKEDEMKETGFLSGAFAGYTYRGKLLTENLPKGMLRLEGRIIFGRVNYDGHLDNGDPYEIKKVKDFTSEFRGLAGYDFTVFSSTTITPYLGLGYRFLKDDLSKDNAGYRRYSNYFYSPIGFETQTPIAKTWTAGVAFEYDYFWYGLQDTRLSDLDPLFSDMTNDQNDGYGIRGSIKIRKEMDDKNYIFEPYVHYWNIGDSTIEKVFHNGVWGGDYALEPKNSTTEIGMKVGVEF